MVALLREIDFWDFSFDIAAVHSTTVSKKQSQRKGMRLCDLATKKTMATDEREMEDDLQDNVCRSTKEQPIAPVELRLMHIAVT